jgi:hypothetical protein
MPTDKKEHSIPKYLEKYDKELYQAIDDLCLLNLFNVRRNGVTFLHPRDKAFRKKIIDYSYSDNPEKAVDMIKSLVLMDYLPEPRNFESRKDDIPNALRKRVEISGTEDKCVMLKSGHKLEIEDKFAPFRLNTPCAVYNLTGIGDFPTSGQSTTMKYIEKKSNSKYCNNTNPDKLHLIGYIENRYYKKNKNIYRAVLAFLFKSALNTNDIDVLCNIYKGMCASARSTFYVLVSPYSSEDPYKLGLLINILCEFPEKLKGNNQSDSINTCAKMYKPLRDKIIVTVREKLSIDRVKCINSSNDIRKKLLNDIDSSVNLRSVLNKAYDGDKQRLAKDVFTVYCFLAVINEDSDPESYKNCFTYVVKNIYNNLHSVLNHNRDLAFNISVYLNLLRSDAFVYEPSLESESPPDEFKRNIPDPTSKTELFSIEKNEITERSDESDNIISSFMSA